MAQIHRDIKLPLHHGSTEYLSFIENRLQIQKDDFLKTFKKDKIEKEFSGLYSLLRLG